MLFCVNIKWHSFIIMIEGMKKFKKKKIVIKKKGNRCIKELNQEDEEIDTKISK